MGHGVPPKPKKKMTRNILNGSSPKGPHNGMSASLILPAHNQEPTIREVVLELLEHIPNCETIVVCNGCSDNTAGVVRDLNDPRVQCLELSEAKKGLAIVEGLKHAKYEIAGFVDTDGAFSGKDVARLLGHINGSDCVIASKWKGVTFAEVNEPFGRKVMSIAYNVLVRSLLGLSFSDTQAGLKIFKKSVYDAISHDFICQGFDFDVELLLKLKRASCRITEEFVPTRKTITSSFKLRHAFGMAWNLLRLALRQS